MITKSGTTAAPSAAFFDYGAPAGSYGSDKVLAREVGGTLDAEIAKGRDRAAILTASRDAIARLVRRGAKTRPSAGRREREEHWGG